MLPNNKLHIFKIALSCLVVSLAVSCKSYYTTLQIEIPTPAKLELPPDIQSLTLMNRSITSQFVDHDADSLQKYFYRNGFQLSEDVLDISVSDTVIQALAPLIYESGRYDVVVPIERNIPRGVPYQIKPDTIDNLKVNMICSLYNTDALMVLEQFSTKVMSDFSREQTVYNNYYYYASIDVKYNAFFRIYQPGKKNPIKEIELTDTIYWESAEYSQGMLFANLPKIKEAITYAAIKVALDTDSQLSPSWNSEKRGYFLFDLKNDRGQQLVNENKLNEAKAYWLEMTQSPNKKDRARAEFNMAVVSELDGDIDQALKWGLKSYYSHYHYQTEVYLKKLNALKENKITK
jgi:hypothetical protein